MTAHTFTKARLSHAPAGDHPRTASLESVNGVTLRQCCPRGCWRLPACTVSASSPTDTRVDRGAGTSSRAAAALKSCSETGLLQRLTWPVGRASHRASLVGSVLFCASCRGECVMGRATLDPSQPRKSVHTGVHYDKQKRKWRAVIKHNGQKQNLGRFRCEHDAGRAVRPARHSIYCTSEVSRSPPRQRPHPARPASSRALEAPRCVLSPPCPRAD